MERSGVVRQAVFASMDTDPGRGSRSNEPPKLATVRRLHLDDGAGSGATATDEWYETERLTGHITGRTRSAAPIDQQHAPSRDQAPVVLDWRHEAAVPPPTAFERLGRALAARRYRRGRRETEGADVLVPPRARRVRRALFATTSLIDQPPL
jgi:hypothetical protein